MDSRFVDSMLTSATAVGRMLIAVEVWEDLVAAVSVIRTVTRHVEFAAEDNAR